MTSADLTRWCGLAAILGAALFIIADLIGLFTLDFDASASEFFSSLSFHLTSALLLVGGPLVLLGLVGLYAGGRPEAMGVLGLIAFLVAFFGWVLSQGAIWSESFISPAIASEAPELIESEPPGVVIFGILLSFVLSNLGWILFGVAVLRARIYPRLAALLLIAGAVVALLLNLLFAGGPPGDVVQYVGTAADIIFFGAIAWMGFVLLAGMGSSAEQPSRVR